MIILLINDIIINMNLKSEQIKADLNIEVNYDQPLSKKLMKDKLNESLQKDGATTWFENICGHRVYIYENNGKKTVLLFKAITYLGGNGQHPIFKKRMQLSNWYKDVVFYLEDKKEYDVKFIGIYHYENNVIFVDFNKDTYMKKKMNSSSAHVYINDLYQAMKYGIFTKLDNLGNTINCVSFNYFKNYLDGKEHNRNPLFDLIDKFNYSFGFDEWIKGDKAILEMKNNNFSQWKQVEWQGFFLEYLYECFIKNEKCENEMAYIRDKEKDALDFDLFFKKQNFYGDLKASDIGKNQAPGNKKESFCKCINMYDKFWYLIYEHDTLKDKNYGFEVTKFRSSLINSDPKEEKVKTLSYGKRMKNQVNFRKMEIIEINRVNFREILSDFNQGHQPDGSSRDTKFMINKRNIDNCVIYRYSKNN